MPERRQIWTYSVALISVALALAPSVSHLLALPNKIGMEEAQYFTAQAIYRGWALLGIVVAAALLSTLVLTVLLRRRRWPMRWALLAFLCVLGTQVLFWLWTFPANQATDDWTRVPADWQLLRSQWEYSHAAGALLTLAAMAALIASVLSWGAGNARARPAGPP